MRSDTTAVWRYAADIQEIIRQWLQLRDGRKDPVLRYKPADLVRLVRLRTWMMRHRLTIFEILDLLVLELRARFSRINRKTKMTGGLRISINTLTSHGAERVLKEMIAKTYPDNEHINIWRERERDRQMAAEMAEEMGNMVEAPEKKLKLVDFDSPVDFVKRYEKRLERQRRVEMAASDPSRKKRAYRWNPFR